VTKPVAVTSSTVVAFNPVTSPSAHVSDPPEHVIHPCLNYTRYLFWLIKYFPEVMNTQGRYFVQFMLKIETPEDITKYLSHFPNNWLNLLGRDNYVKYIPTICNLIIIWSLMLGRDDPVHYTEYYEMRDTVYEVVIEEFKSFIPLDDDLKQLTPPKYSKHSPIVAEHIKSEKSKNTSSKSKHSHSSKSKSMKSYHTTRPTMIDSHGMANGDPDSDPDSSSSSSSSQSSRRPKRSKRSKASKHSDDEDGLGYNWHHIPGEEDLLIESPAKFKVKNSDSDSVIQDRSLRIKPTKF
jgi:hypothetical protein